MEEPILIPVEYQGETLEFPVTVVTFGYAYQLHVQVGDQRLILEKDNEGNFRVMQDKGEPVKIDKGLMQAIVSTIEGLG
ncbi:hypothetical protein DYBT9623_00533 [Dyadobacter sp. CECT 9623]|uniref:Uncharacterized protein n=1 Tax=Dyadobacter linearis TaxID=2823330 RepID=A0ABM8UK34_9BACT|nr:hypothetical protein [Dyadobacter sp. CECT 9623]CAG5067806.1 hypothetical protein DYBT9623_00533 [Dyadobacter sp. CECT 9623]